MRTLPLLTLALLTSMLAACGSNTGFSYVGVDQKLAVSTDGSGTPSVTGGDTTVSGGAGGDDVWVGEEPTPPPTSGGGTEGDDDGDGIGNGDDELPGLCTKMVVVSHGVSSARIALNGVDVFAPSDFHNENITLEKSVNLKDGENSLSIRLAGSPGDQLLVRIYDCSTDPSTLLFEKVVTRTAGQPNTGSGSF
jgi:hypothetical protein